MYKGTFQGKYLSLVLCFYTTGVCTFPKKYEVYPPYIKLKKHTTEYDEG